MQKKSSSHYQHLVAGFAASAFALLVTVSGQHVTMDSPTLTAAAAPTLESCNAKGQAAETKCQKKFDSCSKKIGIKIQKCEQKISKKQNLCNAKAEKSRLKCAKKNESQVCQDTYNIAQDTCNEIAEDAALVCQEMQEVLVDCEEANELCKVNGEDEYNECTSKIKPAV